MRMAWFRKTFRPTQREVEEQHLAYAKKMKAKSEKKKTKTSTKKKPWKGKKRSRYGIKVRADVARDFLN